MNVCVAGYMTSYFPFNKGYLLKYTGAPIAGKWMTRWSHRMGIIGTDTFLLKIAFGSGVVGYASNPRTPEAGAGRSGVGNKNP